MIRSHHCFRFPLPCPLRSPFGQNHDTPVTNNHLRHFSLRFASLLPFYFPSAPPFPPLLRVVVTGYGITSCLGNTVSDVKDSLFECKSGIEHDPKFEELGIKSQVRGKPDLTEADFKEVSEEYNEYLFRSLHH